MTSSRSLARMFSSKNSWCVNRQLVSICRPTCASRSTAKIAGDLAIINSSSV